MYSSFSLTLVLAKLGRFLIALMSFLVTFGALGEFQIPASVHRAEAKFVDEQFPKDKFVIVSLGTIQPSVEAFLEGMGRTDLVRIPVVILHNAIVQFTWPHGTVRRQYSADNSGELIDRFVKYIEYVSGPLNGRKIVIMRRLFIGSTVKTFGEVLEEAQKRLPENHPAQSMEAVFFSTDYMHEVPIPGFAKITVDPKGAVPAEREGNMDGDVLSRNENMRAQPINATDFVNLLMEPTPQLPEIASRFRISPFQVIKYNLERAALFCTSVFR